MTSAASAERRPSIWWVLLRHEWRLTIRDFLNVAGRRARAAARSDAAPLAKSIAKPRRVRGPVFRIGVFAVAIVALHVIGLATLALPRVWTDSAASRLAVVAAVAFLFTFMLSTTMSRVVAAFHERRDLDLMLAAPIDPALVLAVRATTIVIATTATFAVFVYPVLDVGVVTGHWWLARWYLVVPLLAMVCTALALVLTDAVVRVLGVRRARVGLQVFSAVVGASMYFVSQARNFLPADATRRLSQWFVGSTRVDDAPWPVASIAAVARGDPVAWLAFVAIGVASFGLAVRWSRRRFVEIAATPDGSARVVQPARSVIERRFAAGYSRGLFSTLLMKEWRLILRAPQLLSQVLLQLLYLMPLVFIAFRHEGGPPGLAVRWGPAALAAGITGVASTLATALSWLTVAAEDAPDLLAASPRSPGIIVSAKLVAAIAPPVAIVLVAAVGIASSSPSQAAIVFVFGVLSCASAAILAAASPASGKRGDFQRRHKGRGVSAVVEALQFLLWGGAAGTAATGHWLASAGLTLVALVMPSLRLPGALRRVQADE